jgi:hypothetical protein
MRKAKQAPRALRYELVPGEAPRIVLEPWDLVLTGGGGPYRGDRPVVVRTWGRNRLATLGRLLPHARSISVQLVGPGLPAFYVVDVGDAVLTLGLSGWTDGGWAGVATFDLLDPAGADPELGGRLRELLARPRSEAELVAACGRPADAVRAALLGELTAGRVGHDVAAERFFARELFATPLPLPRLRFRDAREEAAHRLLAVADQVRLAKVHDLGAEGTTIEGEINDQQLKRTFRPAFTVDREGRTASAACSCASFQRAGIKEGPCEHMIALRLLYGRQQAELERARGTAEGRKLIRAETRVLLRRGKEGTTVFRVSLDGRQMVVRFGRPDKPRLQRICFEDADAARGQYFAKLEELQRKGFIDASLAE